MENIRPVAIIFTLLLSACSAVIKQGAVANPILSLQRETADLADVTDDAINLAGRVGSHNVLTVFDIDNTLLAMEQGLGSDQWYEWQKDLSQHDACNPRNTGDRFAAQGALFFASAMRPTQADAALQVKRLQDQDLPVIVLSSRGPIYRLQTFRELRRNGLDFSRSAIGPQGGYETSFIPVEKGRLSRYEDGVFMTAGQHKGRMLNTLLKKTGTAMPAVIVVVDDKQKNLAAVEETFDALDIPVHAWRYSAEDDHVNGFDPDKAAAQWQSIETALRQIQKVLGPYNYDLSSAVLPAQCDG